VSPAAKTLDDLADDFLSGPSHRTLQLGLPPLTAPARLPATTPDLDRLKLLVQRRAWRDVVTLAQNLTTGPSSHYAPLYEALLRMGVAGGSPAAAAVLALETHQRDLVLILQLYLHALVKLGDYRALVLEVERWSFCHHNDNTAPEWIPWSLHIQAASTLMYVPKPETAAAGGGNTKDATAPTTARAYSNSCLDALWAIRSDIPDDCPADRMRVENAIANVFIARKEWRMVLACYQRMMEGLPVTSQREAAQLLRHHHKLSADADVVARTLEVTYRADLLSRQGRVLLQAGALDAASQIFAQAETAWQTLDESSKEILSDHVVAVQHIPALLSANNGLLQFSFGKYNEAMEHFRTTVEHLRNNNNNSTTQQPSFLDSLIFSGTDDPDTTAVPTASRESLYSETINNMALSALYTCRLQEALELMESLVREDVTRYLTDRVALNLCTLYELASESAASARKKRVLQAIAKRFFLHDIPPESFRVT